MRKHYLAERTLRLCLCDCNSKVLGLMILSEVSRRHFQFLGHVSDRSFTSPCPLAGRTRTRPEKFPRVLRPAALGQPNVPMHFGIFQALWFLEAPIHLFGTVCIEYFWRPICTTRILENCPISRPKTRTLRADVTPPFGQSSSISHGLSGSSIKCVILQPCGRVFLALVKFQASLPA